MKTFLRWVGGKNQLINKFLHIFPVNINKYNWIEPFLGSGSLLLKFKPIHARLNDINSNLIFSWNAIKNDVNKLINYLKIHQKNSNKEYFEIIKKEFNNFKRDNSIDEKCKQGARMIYLNSRCYNGLYRENSKGEFNVAYDSSRKIKDIAQPNNLIKISKYLNKNDMKFYSLDYKEFITKELKENNNRPFLLILDPPYFSKNENFVAYTKNEWQKDEILKLHSFLTKKFSNKEEKSKFILFNSCCDFTVNLFKDFNIYTYLAPRPIACKMEARKPVKEILVTNFLKKNLLDFYEC